MDESSSALLAEHASDWFSSTRSRRSRRAYEEAPVAVQTLESLEATIGAFRPFGDARVELVRTPETDIFRGIVGSYGKVVGAPHVLAMILRDGPLAQQHLGFVGEAAVLEATTLGLGTCWVAGFFDRSKARRILRLHEDEHVVAVSPLGHAASARTGMERAMSGIAGSHTRKPLPDLITGEHADWPDWAISAVACARLAPSAVNRQPWRFSLEAGDLVLSHTGGPQLPGVAKRLDCGIALLHAELGALSEGVRVQLTEVAEGRVVARLRPEG